MTPKFFYVDDNTAILIAANGTPLLAFMAAIKDIIKLDGIEVPTGPLWIYFWGLIFAFLCKLTIEFINDDTKMREKLQYGRDLAIETMNTPGISESLKRQAEAAFSATEVQYKRLIKPEKADRPAKLRALFFMLSCACFLLATATLIGAATELVEKSVPDTSAADHQLSAQSSS